MNLPWYQPLIAGKSNYVFLETTKCDAENNRSLLFQDPIQILIANSPGEIPAVFAQIETFLKQGLFLAGYFSYECGYHFALERAAFELKHPLIWLGVFRKPVVYEQTHEREPLTSQNQHSEQAESRFYPQGFDLKKQEYLEQIERIKQYIAAGDTYQINFTGRYQFKYHGSSLALYEKLKPKQPVAYGAVINDSVRDILCFSPELFFKLKAGRIYTKPMKGTAPRGRTALEDETIREWLQGDEKNRAENLMIVDLLRNDLGRVCKLGSVKVPQIFEVETYQTLFQMTSTIEGTIADGLTYYELFQSLFPCGSITGAPKVRSMQIIRELETGPRGIYTGAIGYFAPGGEAMFNVPIRTLVIENGQGEMGVGSGIVYDSNPENEYEECLLKTRFLMEPLEFELIEAVYWNGRYRFLDEHLERLEAAANHFGYSFFKEALQLRLNQNSKELDPNCCYKVRVTLSQTGKFHLQNIKLLLDSNASENYYIGVAKVKTDSSNEFLYYKTTARALYDQMYQRGLELGLVDVIFLNERGEVTEGAISNVLVVKAGIWYTPPIKSGILNGIYRRHLLATQADIYEKTLALSDILEADGIYLCNAIRGMRKVQLTEDYWV